MICAFTGHRKLFNDFDKNLLDKAVHRLIREGADKFLCGMAQGFDLEAAESVIFFKKQYDIKLVACIPCANQTDTFSSSDRKRYENILSGCDEVITLAPYYYDGCMLARNRFMIDNSDTLLCYLRSNRGGTCYTVKYAEKLGREIVRL